MVNQLRDSIIITIFNINKLKILITIDEQTKFVSGYTLTAQDNTSIADHMECFMNTHGIPIRLTSNRDVESISKSLDAFSREHNVILRFTLNLEMPILKSIHSTLTEIYFIMLESLNGENQHEENLIRTFTTYNKIIAESQKFRYDVINNKYGCDCTTLDEFRMQLCSGMDSIVYDNIHKLL